MRIRSVQFLSIAGLAALAAVVACSSSSAPQAPPGSATLAGNAAFLNAQTASDVDVETDHLSFPAATHADLMNKVVGDVLVGDKGGAKNPWGFLRKVTAAPTESGGVITIKTANAALTDAVSQATFKQTLATPALGASGPISATGGTTIKLLDFSGTKIFNLASSATLHSGDTIGYTAHATVTTGTLDFSPSFDIGADIEPNLSDPLSSVKEFHVIGTGALAADLEIDAGLALTGNLNGTDLAELIAQGITGSPSTTIANYPIDLGTISLGIISIPVHADFTATLACQVSYGGAEDVAVGGKATASITAGFEYQNAAMSPVYSHSETFTMVGPTWTMDSAIHVRCSVKPEFDLSFFDIASGSIWADPHVSLDAAAVCSSSQLTGTVSGGAQAGIDVAASANVDVLGLYKWSKTCTLYDVESPTASFSGTFTLPGPSSTTSCVSSPPPANPAQPAPPPSCFGGGSTSGGGSDAGSTSTGGGGDDAGTTSSGDDGGSATADGGSGSDGAATSGDGGNVCDHTACVSGDALSATCTLDNQGGACIAAICKNDSFCCTFTWDGSCIAHVTNGDYGCAPSDCP